MNWSQKRTVMVIGYNVRPIACLTKQLGFKVIAVDYWGDLAIADCTDGLLTVLEQKPGELLKSDFDEPISELLVNLAEKAVDKFGRVDFILVGSGLDDRPDLWGRLGRLAPIFGNNPDRFKIIRNPLKVFNTARSLGISTPKTEKVVSPDEAVDIAKKIGFPVVLKPIRSSGGFRLRFCNNPNEVKKQFNAVAGDRVEVWVQEYIRGIDASSSILGNGKECITVSVNEQLIGKKELGVSSPFGYCGNIVPLKANRRIIERIRNASSTLGKKLGLIGSNGFDFVINSNNEPYIIEVNPRFQATLECIHSVTGINLIREHIKACSGEQLSKVPEPNGYAVKMIVFAKEKSVYPDLRGIEQLYDISHKGVIVDKGNPICTIQVVDEDREKTINKALKKASEIYKKLEHVNKRFP